MAKNIVKKKQKVVGSKRNIDSQNAVFLHGQQLLYHSSLMHEG